MLRRRVYLAPCESVHYPIMSSHWFFAIFASAIELGGQHWDPGAHFSNINLGRELHDSMILDWVSGRFVIERWALFED